MSDENADERSPQFARDYERYSPMVYTLALRITHNREAAEEITQDVFARRWVGADAFDPAKGALEGWLRLICHSAAVAWVRGEVSQERRLHRASRLDGGKISPDDVTSAVDDGMTAAGVARDVADALDALSAIQREALTLVYFDGCTHDEVAQLLNIPLGTAHTRVRDGLRKLRDLVGDDGSLLHPRLGRFPGMPQDHPLRDAAAGQQPSAAERIAAGLDDGISLERALGIVSEQANVSTAAAAVLLQDFAGDRDVELSAVCDDVVGGALAYNDASFHRTDQLRPTSTGPVSGAGRPHSRTTGPAMPRQ